MPGPLPGLHPGLHARDELHVSDAQLDQEIEDLVGVIGGEMIHKRERVELDLVLPGTIDGPHDTVPCTVAAKIEPVVIVQVLRSVDADPDEELALAEELAPVGVVQENRIGLEGIADLLAGDAVFRLELDRPLVEVQAHQGRLTPCHAKPDSWNRRPM